MEFVGRADSQVVTNVVCFRSLPDPLGIVLWRGKLEFVGRADSQVVTNVVCFRSLPDPLGIVLWRGKLEFVELFGQWCVGGCGTRPCPPHL